MTNKQQLPDEVLEKINQFVKDKTQEEREYWNKAASDPDRTSTYVAGYEHGVRKGATEYATKLHNLQSKYNLLIKSRQNQNEWIDKAIVLLEKFISRHEAGLLSDRLLYNEIETFLDGK